jgi:hypothetical protein
VIHENKWAGTQDRIDRKKYDKENQKWNERESKRNENDKHKTLLQILVEELLFGVVDQKPQPPEYYDLDKSSGVWVYFEDDKRKILGKCLIKDLDTYEIINAPMNKDLNLSINGVRIGEYNFDKNSEKNMIISLGPGIRIEILPVK